VWAIKIIVFSGIMNAERLQQILETGLLPFLRNKFADANGHRLYHDNDPKHASGHIEERENYMVAKTT